MLGLVLEGGGVKGAYQMGAWEAFRALGMEFGAVTGTSVGALNGALYVQGDYEKAYEMWYNLRPEHVIEGNAQTIEKLASLEFEAGDFEAVARYLASVFTSGGLDITPLKGLLNTMVDETRIRASAIDFGIVTVSLTDFKPLELFVDRIPEGRLAEYLLASANLPIFKVDRKAGKKYIDGGFYDNLPINLITQRDIRQIVAVELQAPGIRQPVKRDDLTITWVTPSEDTGPLLDFNQERIRRNMKLGYCDALRVFKGFSGTTYYLEGALEPGWGLRQLMELSEEDLAPIRSWMEAEDMDSRRFLFEMLLPVLGTLLEAPVSADYDSLLLRYYEAMARRTGIERLQILKIPAFLEQVEKSCAVPCPAPGSLVEAMARRLRQTPAYLKTRKDEFLPWVFQHLIGGFHTH